MNLFNTRISKIVENKILPGYDYLTTIRAEQLIEIPPNFMGTGIDGFKEMVTFIGAPLQPAIGNADTVMERAEVIDFSESQKISTRLVAFANVSAAPLKVTFGSRTAYFDLYVTLSPTIESPGKSKYQLDKNGYSGSFESEVSLSPLFELRPLGKGQSFFIDTGKTELPGFPMRLGSTGGKWSLKPDTENAVRHFGGVSLFYTDEVEIIAKNGDNLQAACVKRQAEFISESYNGEFGRQGFPSPKPFQNIEIN